MSNIVSKLIKKFDSEDVIRFADKDGFKEIKSWAFTGSPELDFNLGTLGFPTGIIELGGKSRSGKTTLGLMGMYYFMKNNENGIVVILSSENRDNKEYAVKLGIDLDKVIIMKVRYVEKMFMMVKKLIDDTKVLFKEEKLGTPKFYFMWDSLGATLSKSELDTMEENTEKIGAMMEKGEDGEKEEKLKHEKIGAFAKSAKMFAKYILGEMYDTTIHFVMLNHVYDTIGGGGQSTKKSTGGEWVELFPTIRLRTAVREHVKVGEVEVGQITQVKVVKNDFGSRKETLIEILLGYGVVLSEEDISFGISQGILVKESAKKISFMGDKLKWSSKKEYYQNYIDKNKFLPILTSKIMKARHKMVEDSKTT